MSRAVERLGCLAHTFYSCLDGTHIKDQTTNCNLLRPHSYLTMASKNLRFNPDVDVYDEIYIASPALKASNGPGLTVPVLDAALQPGRACPPVDFSLPSAVFRADPHLDDALLGRPACQPPVYEVHIRVLSADGIHGLCNIAVVHNPRYEPVTVGDVLSTIRDKLRQTEACAEQDVRWYYAKRVETLDGYCSNLETNRKERTEGTRRVDRLRGNVLFTGIAVPSPAEPRKWQLQLAFSPRYANA
ncbi:hypothetical protein MVEN_01111100 [Mycena venus]|uniref:DUF6699 domain-containing protein n=1 Tax=Mycena venus TaxID=2733690 RepID=A0A8H6Y6M8_9AGAR|nr:hypothetical protein MVEN_01111100 [Mycena venus]